MGLIKSKSARKSGDAVKAEQTSANSKDVATGRRINDQMVQNVHLIWLDSDIDDSKVDYQKTITQLRHTVNTINTYTNGRECIQFLDKMGDETACMIISGSLGQGIVAHVHSMSQVDSIFIFCNNKKYHEEWAKQWSKIKGVFTEISPLYDALKQAVHQCEQNAISMSFVATSSDNFKKNLDQLHPSFVCTQILKEILLTIKFEQKHIAEFISYCREVFADNEGKLQIVNKFERKYRDETPIWWYTYECFLYPILNRTLRLMDADMISKLGFFISDLHRHIEQLHQEQFKDNHSGNNFMVYRGQGMSKTDFEQMNESEDGFISFNNFLSTSKNRTVSIDFAIRAATNSNLVGILFVITIDPSRSTTPFASITAVSYNKNKEDEVLFGMHTIFRICNITLMDENRRLFQVELTLTSDNDKDLRQLTNHIREETFPETEGWYRLGLVLLKMNQSDKAEEVYEVLLEQVTDENEKAPIYHQIGYAKNNQKEYKEAITFYKKALEIYKKTLSSTDGGLANCYTDIGDAHVNLNEYSKALSSYAKVLKIRQQSLTPYHPDLGASYNNIGNVYFKMGEYSNALSSYEKALEIRQQSLPPNHPDLGMSYNNIGFVYEHAKEYSKARWSYERAVNIAEHSLPANHPTLRQRQKNLDRVKYKL